MTTENAGFVYTLRYSRCGQPINDDRLSVSALGRCPPIAGNLTLKCVVTFITSPYTAGGRSRRGSPKAGTTVHGLIIRICLKPVNIKLFILDWHSGRLYIFSAIDKQTVYFKGNSCMCL